MSSEVSEEFYLDFDRESLYGFQGYVDGLVVEAMRLGIGYGSKFPRCSVVRKDGIYQLDFGGSGGGHHRALAHYKEQVSLSSVVLSSHTVPSRMKYTLISDHKVQDGFSSDRLAQALIYLPSDVAKSFCEENRGKIFNELGGGRIIRKYLVDGRFEALAQ